MSDKDGAEQKGNEPMGDDIRDELADIKEILAVSGERQKNMAEDIKEIKDSTHEQEVRCRTITAGYTNSLAKLSGKIIKTEGCITAIKGRMKQMILVAVGTATLVGAIAALVGKFN